MSISSLPPVVVVRDAHLGFERPILGPLTLEIPQGGRWALTGPNGVGKSLLLKAIMGQARVHAGQLVKARSVRASLLAQDHPRPSPWPLSGNDWFRAMGVQPPASASVRALLPRRLDHLSGGQWQLLRLAAVTASLPRTAAEDRLILLDEPTNHLDAEVRQEAVALIRAIPATSTLLMTSHDEDLLGAVGVDVHPLAEYLDVE